MAVGLIDFNPSVQRFHLDRVRAYLDMAFLFEAKNVLLVLGEYIWQKEVIPPESSGGRPSSTCRPSANTPPSSAWRSHWSSSRSLFRS